MSLLDLGGYTKNMQIQTFTKAAIFLSSAFPDRKFEPEIYFELLKDLKDEFFLMAVIDVCKTQKEMYPGTNLIAILRERTCDIARLKSQKTLKLPAPTEKNDPSKSLKKMFDEEVSRLAEIKSI